VLIQFNFKNFKSFRDEVSLDLSATKITEFPDHIAHIGNEKVLKLAVIFGANASGKTNVYEAFEFMRYYVLNSFAFGGDSDKNDGRLIKKMKSLPFLFDNNSRKKESSFEVLFLDTSEKRPKIYQYGFSLYQEEVLEEWLFSKSMTGKEYKTIFYRKKGEKINYEGLSKTSIENIDTALEKETLIVSLGAKLKVSKLKLIRDWFYKTRVINYGNPIVNMSMLSAVPTDFPTKKEVQKDVIKYLSTFDDSIKDFDVEIVNDEGEEWIFVKSYHKNIDTGKPTTFIPLQFESSGTLKMFSLYQPIKEVLTYGGTLFVDELSDRLHPLLLRNLILLFTDKYSNPNNAQLIFTSHDIWHLDYLRRDEIWFVEKDSNQVSTLYSLIEFRNEAGNKIRKDETFVKNYVTGKYGAVPKLRRFDFHVGEHVDEYRTQERED